MSEKTSNETTVQRPAEAGDSAKSAMAEIVATSNFRNEYISDTVDRRTSNCTTSDSATNPAESFKLPTLDLHDARAQANVDNMSNSDGAGIRKPGSTGGFDSPNSETKVGKPGSGGLADGATHKGTPGNGGLDSSPANTVSTKDYLDSNRLEIVDGATKKGAPGSGGLEPCDSLSDKTIKTEKSGGWSIAHDHETSGEMTAEHSTDKTLARDSQLIGRYGADTNRANYKYTGMNDQEVSDYRKLDEGKEQPGGGPDGKGWDNAVDQNPETKNAEDQLKQKFDQMKNENEASGKKPTEEQMQQLDQLNKQFIDTLRDTVKDNPEMLKQLDVLQALYQKRNRALFQKPGGQSSDM